MPIDRQVQHRSIDGDPQRVAVGGESSGANLATVVCLRARDQGDPLPTYQALIYPVTNYAFDTPSYEENADNIVLSRDIMRWFWQQYLPDEQAGQYPYASPLRAPDLSGLPPAVIITAEYDPLRDEGEAYAQRLRAARVPVVSSRYAGMVHIFFRLMTLLEPAQKAVVEVAAGLRSAFSRTPELAPSDIMPLGAVVAAEEQARKKVQMTVSNQPPEDIRTPGTPIRPAPLPADERDATQPGAAASESAPIISPDTRVRESVPVIPTDLDEDRGVAATLPKGTAPSESAPLIPGGKPGQERAPIIPPDAGLLPTESVIPAERPQEASAPIIPTDAQERQAAREAEDTSAPPASEATRDTP